MEIESCVVDGSLTFNVFNVSAVNVSVTVGLFTEDFD